MRNLLYHQKLELNQDQNLPPYTYIVFCHKITNVVRLDQLQSLSNIVNTLNIQLAQPTPPNTIVYRSTIWNKLIYPPPLLQ